jgi:hypothetical protein
VLLYGYDFGNDGYTIENAYIATPLEFDQPLNSLYHFKVGSAKYVAWDIVSKYENSTPKTLGYFEDNKLRSRLRLGHVYTTTFYPKDIFFTDVYANSIVPLNSPCNLSIFKYNGCESGKLDCEFIDTADIVEIMGPILDLEVPTNINCNDSSGPVERVCCSVGIRFVEDQRTGATSNQSQRELLANPEQNEALFAIGEIICDIGKTIFNDFGQYNPEYLPEPLLLLGNRLQAIGNGDTTYVSMVQSFKDYRDELFSYNIQLVSIEDNDWESVVFLLNEMEDSDFYSINTNERYKAVKVISDNMGEYIDSLEIPIAVGAVLRPGGQDMIVHFKDKGGVDRKRVFYRLCSIINPSSRDEFLSLLLSDEVLLKNIFAGFNTTNFFGGGQRGEYFEMIQVLMEQLKLSSHTPEGRPISRDIAINVGFLPEPGETVFSDRCAIKLTGDCFGEMTFKWPIRVPFADNNDNELFDFCIYAPEFLGGSSLDTTIVIDGPLDYVPLYVNSSDYGGILDSGLYAVPAFLICYLKDDLNRTEANAAFKNLVNAAVIVISVATLPSAGGALLLIEAIDVAGAVLIGQVNENIENGVLRGRFDTDEEYNEFVKKYRAVEEGYNYVTLGAAGSMLTAAAARGLIRAIDDAGGFAHLANSGTRFVRRLKGLVAGSKKLTFIDLPLVKALVDRVPGQSDAVYNALVKFDERTLRRLNDDLLVNSTLGDVLIETPSGFASYQLLSTLPASTAWRLDVDIIRQLGADINVSPLLKSKLLSDGPDGVRAWKLIDDNTPSSVWCPN